jgi:hypothetical protein
VDGLVLALSVAMLRFQHTMRTMGAEWPGSNDEESKEKKKRLNERPAKNVKLSKKRLR